VILPKLYKRSSTGKIVEWEIEVRDGDPVQIVTRHGQTDGKIQEGFRDVRSGKNIGKANETTALEQAALEAKSKWTLRQKKGYCADPSGINLNQKPLPMLAHKFMERKHNIKYPCAVQPKLNGVRCLTKRVPAQQMIEFTSRGGNDFETLGHLVLPLARILTIDQMLDGEIYVHGWSFQKIIRRVKRAEEQYDDVTELEYWIYDMPDKADFQDRWKWITENVPDDPSLKLVKTPTYIVESEDEIHRYHDIFIEQGFEGIIIRNLKGGYRFQYNNKNLQKLKKFHDDEFEVIGAKEGQGKESGCVIWVCKTRDGKEFDVRPEGTLEERRILFQEASNYFGKMYTVRYQDLSEDGIPMILTGIAFRDYE